MPLRQQVHGDDSPNSIHIQQQQYAVGGSQGNGKLCVKQQVCRKTHSQDNPFDRLETLLSDIPRQRAYCEQRVVILLSVVLSVPIPWGTLVLPQCLHGTDHVPDCTSSYSSLAQAE